MTFTRAVGERRSPENIHRFATVTSRLLLLLLFRRLPLLRLFMTLSVLLTTALLFAPLRRRRRSHCMVYGVDFRMHRQSWQSTSFESPYHLPWQIELVDWPYWLLLPAILADSFHLFTPTYLSRLSLPGRSTQMDKPVVISIAHRFCSSINGM